MEVEFRDERLALIETDRFAESGVPVSVINSLRRKLVVIRSAPDERTLRNWKSLHFEKLKAREGEYSIRLNDQWRLVFELDKRQVPTRMIVVRVEDYH